MRYRRSEDGSEVQSDDGPYFGWRTRVIVPMPFIYTDDADNLADRDETVRLVLEAFIKEDSALSLPTAK